MIRILLFLLFATSNAYAEETKSKWSWSEVELLSVEYQDLRRMNHPYFLIEKQDGKVGYKTNWDFMGAVDFNVGLINNTIHWNNRLFATMSEHYSHVRHVGYETDFDFHLFPNIDIFAYHKSEHMLEMERKDGLFFPSTDSIGIKIFFIDNTGRKKNSMINTNWWFD